MDVSKEYRQAHRLLANETAILIPIPGIETTLGGLVGILTYPTTKYQSTPNLAILVHGSASHKNANYQRLTAHNLASENGWYSFRYDFRGCGDSYFPETPDFRPLKRDLEDFDIVMKFFNSFDNYKHLIKDQKLHYMVPQAIIGHSRGVITMFQWSINQWDKYLAHDTSAILVPYLINCSGRYTGSDILEKWAPKNVENWSNIESYPLKTYKNKKRGVTIMMTKAEIIETSKHMYQGQYDLSKLNDSNYYKVLTIFGLSDQVIEIEDAHKFTNDLHKIHTLKLIKGADHNYYGISVINNENKEIENPNGVPLNSAGFVNYNHVVKNEICGFLNMSNLMKLRVQDNTMICVQKVSRWKNIEGISNFRDIGGYPVKDLRFLPSSVDSNNLIFKTGLIFRCADTSQVTTNGINSIHNDLNIKTIIDVRSDGEITKQPFPKDINVFQDLNYIHHPMFAKLDLSPELIFLRYENLLSSSYTWTIPLVYLNFIKDGTECISFIMKQILNGNTPMVYHCAAGKDRTGVLTMLILLLAGVCGTDIAKDYELTTIGISTALPKMKETFTKEIERFVNKFKQNNPESPSPLFELNEKLGDGDPEYDLLEDGFNNLISSKYETMLITLKKFNDIYGDVYQYFENKLGFKESEIKELKSILVGVNNRENAKL